MKNVLKKTSTSLEKAEILYHLAEAKSNSDSTEAFKYSRAALELFEKNQDSLGIARARNVLGLSYFNFGDPEDAEKNHRQALEIAEKLIRKDSSYKHMKLWTHSNFSMGVSMSIQGKKSEELEYYLAAAPIARKIKDYRMLAIMNTNFAIMYVNNKEFENAYPYFEENTSLFKNIELQSTEIHDRLIFAYCLKELDSLDRMKTILNNVKDNLAGSSNNLQIQLYHNILGEYYSKVGNYNLALDNYAKSKKIIEDNNLKWYLEGVLENYSKTYLKMGNRAMAKKYLYELLALSETLLQTKINASEKLAILEEEDGEYKKALKFLNLRNSLKDSLDSRNIKNDIAQLEIQYQTEKKENKILELQNENSLTDLNLEKKKSQNYLLLILLGSLSFILVSGYLTYNNRRKKALLKEQVQSQEIQQLKVEQERKLFGVMMEGVEQERKRLAADLHDGLGGRLSGISIKLSRLAENKKAETLLPHLDDILGNLDDSLQELRGVARNLMPETLLKYGLKAAVEDYCSTLGDKETNITLQFYNTENVTDKNELLTLYRIIQELINNAIKHAKATEILVQCIVSDDKIDITIEDDGRGFEVDNVTKKMGVGLTSLKNRVDYLNGTMDIRSEINEGTSINIQIEKA
ncbi:sensor histidine kinase [Maribacter algarum]|uniref:ATP-binding protein n=1 Tax=Maribacter algarum (ex Zhang et al. 2020) TaxID=2578118 RepID=UPI001486D3F4|nr:sensor histidine kinase [Maribacter algarum]